MGSCQEVYRAALGHRRSPGSVAFKFLIGNLVETENRREIFSAECSNPPQFLSHFVFFSASFHNA